jgi:hypothetical protein
MIEIKNIYGDVIYTAPDAKSLRVSVCEAVKSSADLSSADLKGALIDNKPIEDLRLVSVSSYPYQIQAILFQDGSRWVRMGCLFKSLEDWDKIGIRNSNLSEFPDDGSERSEERAAAFEFAKATGLRMKLSESANA